MPKCGLLIKMRFLYRVLHLQERLTKGIRPAGEYGIGAIEVGSEISGGKT